MSAIALTIAALACLLVALIAHGIAVWRQRYRTLAPLWLYAINPAGMAAGFILFAAAHNALLAALSAATAAVSTYGFFLRRETLRMRRDAR